jgi:uncharacterized protein (DUF1697 family)
MVTCISLLRGINVSGQKPVKMLILKEIYEGLNLTNVRTYLQSGNVIFQYPGSDIAVPERMIPEAIRNHFGFDVPVIVLDLQKLEKVVRENPFLKDNTKMPDFFYVTFLSSRPGDTGPEKIVPYQGPGEAFSVRDEVVYLYCPYRYGRTKLNNNLFEKKFGLTATTRNWKTVVELMKIAESYNS